MPRVTVRTSSFINTMHNKVRLLRTTMQIVPDNAAIVRTQMVCNWRETQLSVVHRNCVKCETTGYSHRSTDMVMQGKSLKTGGT